MTAIPAAPDVEVVAALAQIGITAFTTTRAMGSFALTGPEPAEAVWGRWLQLADSLAPLTSRLVFAHQVHGAEVCEHGAGWNGILRVPDADGHLALTTPTAMAVSVADCVPVFIAHPSGAAAVVHSGWRGTAAEVTASAIRRFVSHGYLAAELRVHAGPSICGLCYEVSPDVYLALTGEVVEVPTPVDLRALIARGAEQLGVRHITASDRCTRCHNDTFFSHRAGDVGRQLGVIVARPDS